MAGSRPGSAASRPGSATGARPGSATGTRPGSAASRPGSAAGSRPGSGGAPRPGSSGKKKKGKKKGVSEMEVDEETMVMLMRHRLDFVTPNRKVRLQTNSLVDAGDELVSAAGKGRAAAQAVVDELVDAGTVAQNIGEVQAWATSAKEAIDQRAAALVQEMTRVRELKVERLQGQIAQIDAMVETVGGACTLTRAGSAEVDEGGKPEKLNKGMKRLERALDRFGENPVPLAPCETGNLRLETPLAELLGTIEHAGAVAGLRARVSGVSPLEIPGGGCDLEIAGSDFGTDPELLEVWVGSNRCESIEVVEGEKHEALRCIVPPGSGVGLKVDVRLCGEEGWSAPGTAVSYAAPRIDALDPPGGPIGTEMVIRGAHLGGTGAPPRVTVGGLLCPEVEVIDPQYAVHVLVPENLDMGTYPVVVSRGSQSSTPDGELPAPTALYDVSVKRLFGFDASAKRNGGGLEFDLPSEEEGLIFTVKKLENGNPDYSTAVGTESFKRGIHVWEVNLDRVGNTRIGLARMPLPLDVPLHSRELAGEAWFVDYDGVVKHNKRGVLTELKQMLPISEEFQDGDTIGFHLDLRDNARFNPEDEESNPALAVGRGKLTLRFKGRSFLVASDLAGELWPVFNMDNIREQLTLDFVIDGKDANGQAEVIRRKLEVPSRHDLEALFKRIDTDRSGMLSLAEVSEALHDFYPDIEQAVISRAFSAADRASGGEGKLDHNEFRKLFEYLIFFNNVFHLFETIDSSGDGMLSLAEFKTGAHLILADQVTDKEVESEFRKMDEEDEEQGEVQFDDFCNWVAFKVMGLPTPSSLAASSRPGSAVSRQSSRPSSAASQAAARLGF